MVLRHLNVISARAGVEVSMFTMFQLACLLHILVGCVLDCSNLITDAPTDEKVIPRNFKIIAEVHRVQDYCR